MSTYINTLRQNIQQMTETLQAIEDYGPDDWEHGTVITFDKQKVRSGKVYTYAALKAAGRWYLTGKHIYPLGWDSLLKFMVEGLPSINVLVMPPHVGLRVTCYPFGQPHEGVFIGR